LTPFNQYFGRSPERLGLTEVHAYQVQLVSAGVSWAGFNQAVCAIRFFYGVTLRHRNVFGRHSKKGAKHN
jgi:integrase/recombinase XerD